MLVEPSTTPLSPEATRDRDEKKAPVTGRITANDIRARKKGAEKIVCLTAYDFPTAKALDRAGVDILLVGDSLGMVVLGYETTLPVTMDDMLHHARAVARAKPQALVVADMPWLSYHVSIEQTVLNAGRFIKEAGVDAVKLEGGLERISAVKALIDAKIPVMGHLGLTPQSVLEFGGFKVQGRLPAVAERMVEGARALEEAGCFSLVLEGIPSTLADRITGEIGIPTIGIGAGAGTDGQVLVIHDLVGYGEGRVPKFVRRYADVSNILTEAAGRFLDDVRKGRFPSSGETYSE